MIDIKGVNLHNYAVYQQEKNNIDFGKHKKKSTLKAPFLFFT